MAPADPSATSGAAPVPSACLQRPGDVLSRTAGAPVSWGISEVAGWGHQMPADRVLAEMRGVGLTATELGPDGFLPADPHERQAVLSGAGLGLVGGFVPVVLHESGADPVADSAAALQALAEGGAAMMVLAADSGAFGYEERVVLDGDQWCTLLANLVRVRDAAAGRGVQVALHPHVGTAVERSDEVHRVLDGCDVPLCLDTGHLLIGGTDPAALVAEAAGRVAHAHLKDVDAILADRVRDAELTYSQAVAQGMYRPLGQGDVDIAGIVSSLEKAGYRGWYVLEQDAVLTGEPAPGAGPVADVHASLTFLEGVAG